jgi:hypothetical protein
MYRRELLTLDEKEIMANALAISKITWEHFRMIANER